MLNQTFYFHYDYYHFVASLSAYFCRKDSNNENLE